MLLLLLHGVGRGGPAGVAPGHDRRVRGGRRGHVRLVVVGAAGGRQGGHRHLRLVLVLLLLLLLVVLVDGSRGSRSHSRRRLVPEWAGAGGGTGVGERRGDGTHHAGLGSRAGQGARLLLLLAAVQGPELHVSQGRRRGTLLLLLPLLGVLLRRVLALVARGIPILEK